MIEAVYKKIDVNGRGTVTRDEMMEFGRFMNSKFDEEKLNKLMDQMDLDKIADPQRITPMPDPAG